MTENMQNLRAILENGTEHWDPVQTDQVPDYFPEDITAEDGPFSWKFNGTSVVLYIDYRDAHDGSMWTFGGDGSVIKSRQDFDDIQSEAAQYLLNQTSKPSSMIVG